MFSFERITTGVPEETDNGIIYYQTLRSLLGEDVQTSLDITDSRFFFKDALENNFIHLKSRPLPRIIFKSDINVPFKIKVKAVQYFGQSMKELPLYGQTDYNGSHQLDINDLSFVFCSSQIGNQKQHLLVLIELLSPQPMIFDAFISTGLYVQARIMMDPQRLKRFDTQIYFNWFHPAHLKEYEESYLHHELIGFLNQPFNTEKKLNPIYLAVRFRKSFQIFYNTKLFSDPKNLLEFYFQHQKSSNLTKSLCLNILISSDSYDLTYQIYESYSFPNLDWVQVCTQQKEIDSNMKLLTHAEIILFYNIIYKHKSRQKNQKQLYLMDPDFQRRSLKFKINTLLEKKRKC